MQYYGLSPAAFSLLFASNVIGLIGAAQVNRWLTRHHDTHVILRAASMANLAAALLLPVLAWTGIGGFPAFFADIFLCLMTVGLILPNTTAAVMAPFPHQAGSLRPPSWACSSSPSARPPVPSSASFTTGRTGPWP